MDATEHRKSILEKQFSCDSDVILIDRGLIDTLSWDYYYGSVGRLTPEEVTYANNFFQSIGIKFPDLVVYLSISPEESICRRGGEGRLVTLEFLKTFNDSLNHFLNSISIPVFHLDTTKMTKEEVFETILKNIPIQQKNYEL